MEGRVEGAAPAVEERVDAAASRGVRLAGGTFPGLAQVPRPAGAAGAAAAGQLFFFITLKPRVE